MNQHEFETALNYLIGIVPGRIVDDLLDDCNEDEDVADKENEK